MAERGSSLKGCRPEFGNFVFWPFLTIFLTTTDCCQYVYIKIYGFLNVLVPTIWKSAKNDGYDEIFKKILKFLKTQGLGPLGKGFQLIIFLVFFSTFFFNFFFHFSGTFLSEYGKLFFWIISSYTQDPVPLRGTLSPWCQSCQISDAAVKRTRRRGLLTLV